MDSRLKQSGCLTASLAACFNFNSKSDFPALQALAWGRIGSKGIGYQTLSVAGRIGGRYDVM